MKKTKYIGWGVILLFLIVGCNLDNLDFSKLSKDVALNPSYVAPIAKANIMVWDLIQSANKGYDDIITKDPNGLVKIVYRKNNLFKYNVRDFLTFPIQQAFSSGDKQLGEITPANVSVNRSISLGDLVNSVGGGLDAILPYNGLTVPFPAFSLTGLTVPFTLDPITDYTKITLSKGTLEINLENKLKVPVTIKGNLYDLGYNHKIADFSFTNIASNGISKSTSSLAGLLLSNRVEFRMTSFETNGSATPVNVNLNDFFKMTFDLKSLGISSGNLMVKSQVLEGFSGSFGFVFPEPDLKAYAMVLKKGTMTIKTSNTSKLSGNINFILNEFKKSSVPIKASIPLSGNSTTIDLAGADINFASDLSQPYNRIPYSYSLQVNNSNGYIDYLSTDVLKMDITLSNLEIKSILGDFGKRETLIDKGNFDMDIDMLSKFEGNFKLVNPKMELILHNSIGVPAAITMNFTGTSKDGKTAALNPPVFDIPVPASINAGTVTQSVFFTNQNSNIVNFIALPPTENVSYSGKVNFNTTNVVTLQNPNFFDLDASFGIDLALELPLELKISNLTFKDTSSISGTDFDKLENADLIINAKNGIPLDVDLQLFFVDTIAKKQIGASKKARVLTAAQVSASGVITPVQSSQTFSLDNTDIQNLRKANGIVFSGSVSSPSGGTGVATIYSDSKIEMNVVIKSKINL